MLVGVDQSVAGMSLSKGLTLGRTSRSVAGNLLLLFDKALLACL